MEIKQQAISAFKPHAMKTIQQFNGDSEIERWIARFEMACRIDGVPDSNKADVLAMKLEGPAFDVWKNLPTSSQASSDEIFTGLRSAFGLRRMEAWRKGRTRGPILPGENVDAAYDELCTLAGTAVLDEPTEKSSAAARVATFWFLERLPIDIQDQILLRCGKTMNSKEVVACARELLGKDWSLSERSAAAASVSTQSNIQSQSNIQRRREELRCYTCGNPSHISRNCQQSGGGAGNDQRTCYRCGGVGHMSRECISPTASPKVCYTCGGIGHFSSQCFRRKSGNEHAELPARTVSAQVPARQ